MASFSTAAYDILRQEGKPLKANEILRRALAQGLITTQGKTPVRTMWSSMYQHTKFQVKDKRKAKFKYLGNNLWGLTEWY
jgi:DNA-directed RNA polymerase delta subunit